MRLVRSKMCGDGQIRTVQARQTWFPRAGEVEIVSTDAVGGLSRLPAVWPVHLGWVTRRYRRRVFMSRVVRWVVIEVEGFVLRDVRMGVLTS